MNNRHNNVKTTEWTGNANMPTITDNINNNDFYYNYNALLITEKRKTIFCVLFHTRSAVLYGLNLL